jgi:hypothetical protein
MQVGRVRIADVVSGETRVAVQGYVGLCRSFGSGDDGHGHCAQARDQHIDGQHDHRMLAGPWQLRIPDVAPERIHGLVGVFSNYSRWQRSRLSRIELVIRGSQIHLLRAPVKQAETLSHELRWSVQAQDGSVMLYQFAGKPGFDPRLHGDRPAVGRLPPRPGLARSRLLVLTQQSLVRDCGSSACSGGCPSHVLSLSYNYMRVQSRGHHVSMTDEERHQIGEQYRIRVVPE